MSRVRVALLQIRAFDVEDVAQGLAHTLDRIDEAARERPGLVALPEMAYPAYYLGEEPKRRSSFDPQAALKAFRRKAAEHGVHIAVGMALESRDGGLVNGAALIGSKGEVIGRYAKSYLWHFDRRWFAAGSAYPVFETSFGRVGMLVCADGRLPEIARSLAVAGAQMIVDLTAWVAWGLSPGDLTSAQREYMMPVRALENGVPIVAADKVGVEQRSVVYCGRSCVIGADGGVLATLGPDEEATLVYDLELPDSPATPVPRRPELYGALTEPTDSLPVTAALGESDVVRDASRRVAAVQARLPADATLVDEVRRWARLLATQDCDLVLFPASRLGEAADPAVVPALAAVSQEAGADICVTLCETDAGFTYRTSYLLSKGAVALAHRQTHARDNGLSLGDTPCPVVDTKAGRVGLMIDDEGLVPEVARSLMLRGAEIILWPAARPQYDVVSVARCRADENRVYVTTACAPGPEGATLVISPAGQLVASALRGRTMATHGQVNRALTRWKDMAPGTHVVYGRQPETYGELVRPQ